MQPAGCETSSTLDTSLLELLTSAASARSSLTTLLVSLNATSSQASADGHSPPASQDGPTTANSGPVPVRASRSASRARVKGKRTSDTCGPSSSDCSVPDGPLSGWENRLRQRLSTGGWTKYPMIWKASVTPAGRQLSRLVLSELCTNGKDYGLLPTPSGTSSHGKNHVSGRLDEWGGSSNPWRGTEIGKVHCAPFELWMMGFSDAWRQQMPQETPSSRKSRRK